MKEETRLKLGALLQKQKDPENAGRASQDTRSADPIDLKSFLHLQNNTIRPAMEEIGGYARRKGYFYFVETKEDLTPEEGASGPLAASITIYFSMDGNRYPPETCPHLRVAWMRGQSRLHFHQSGATPGSKGSSESSGDALVSEMTRGLIQGKLLQILSGAFR